MICPVCGKKVGAWHANGVHPKCLPAVKAFGETASKAFMEGFTSAIARLSQAQRDDILRKMRRDK